MYRDDQMSEVQIKLSQCPYCTNIIRTESLQRHSPKRIRNQTIPRQSKKLSVVLVRQYWDNAHEWSDNLTNAQRWPVVRPGGGSAGQGGGMLESLFVCEEKQFDINIKENVNNNKEVDAPPGMMLDKLDGHGRSCWMSCRNHSSHHFQPVKT